jgi:hypothetical protein
MNCHDLGERNAIRYGMVHHAHNGNRTSRRNSTVFLDALLDTNGRVQMRWTRQGLPHKKPMYKEEKENPRKQKEEHTSGWPHFDLKGNCICLCKRCMGASGCICKGCAGIGHVNCPHADTLLDGSKRDKVHT